MTDVLPSGDGAVRLAFFAAILAVMAVWEWAAPLRQRTQPAWQRWTNHMALLAIGALLLRVALPFGLAGFAIMVSEYGWGLFNLWIAPVWVSMPIALVLLDVAIYGQHRLMHSVPSLWRLHRVHHADTHIDVTTALRFHPLELAVSTLWKLALITFIGASAESVLLFELILNGTAMFNHANVALPRGMEPVVRRLIVTPEMHHIHHSMDMAETNSNFGFSTSLWDRLFATYSPSAKNGPDGIVLGLSEFRAPADGRLWPLLLQPFRPQK